MLLQALLSIALITLIAGALLTSALVNVKVASHETATRLATAALARGTDEFVNWAQRYVSKYGASASWPTSTITDQPEPACLGTLTTSSPCSSFVTISYAVIGSSASSNGGPDLAVNLQGTLNENRISGAVTATITDHNGDVKSSDTSLLTVRVFNASPFAILTGARSATAMAGSAKALQGDSGGYRDVSGLNYNATPDPKNPSEAKDTAILVTMSCSNSVANDNRSLPFEDNKAPGNDLKPWGTSGGSGFEAPCEPAYDFSASPTIPSDATIPDGNVYNIGRFGGLPWSERSPGQSGWPK